MAALIKNSPFNKKVRSELLKLIPTAYILIYRRI